MRCAAMDFRVHRFRFAQSAPEPSPSASSCWSEATAWRDRAPEDDAELILNQHRLAVHRLKEPGGVQLHVAFFLERLVCRRRSAAAERKYQQIDKTEERNDEGECAKVPVKQLAHQQGH